MDAKEKEWLKGYLLTTLSRSGPVMLPDELYGPARNRYQYEHGELPKFAKKEFAVCFYREQFLLLALDKKY